MAKKKCDPCNVNTTSFPDMFKALCCQMAEINASLSESGSSSGETNEKLDTVNENLEKVLESLTLMLEEMTNDDNFGDTLWEAPNGDIVIKRTVKKDDGTVVDEYLNPDGTPYTGSTSDLKPYTRQTVITTTDYCANSVPFTLIQFRDHDTKEVIATIWRNDNTLAEQVTAPTGATKGVCVAAAACKENKTYQIKGIKTITFAADKVYAYKAGVWNGSNPMTPLTGKVSLEEGAGVVLEYGFGDSFGNGDEENLMPNAIIIKGLDADADIRISVIQECGYTPTIV